MIYDEINHASHEHGLKLLCNKTPYMCNGCKQIGFGPRYRCEPCNYDLHRDCAFAAIRISHPFFENCDFHFFTEICNACELDVQGFVYHCMKCKRDLHPGCAKLPRSIGSDDVRMELRPKVSSKCNRCGWKKRQKQFRSWSYVSSCGGYCFHVSCVKEEIVERWGRWRFGNDGDVEAGESSTALALEDAASSRQLTIRNGGSGTTRNSGRYWRILKLALKFVISVIVGDPTAVVGGLIASLISS